MQTVEKRNVEKASIQKFSFGGSALHYYTNTNKVKIEFTI